MLGKPLSCIAFEAFQPAVILCIIQLRAVRGEHRSLEDVDIGGGSKLPREEGRAHIGSNGRGNRADNQELHLLGNGESPVTKLTNNLPGVR